MARVGNAVLTQAELQELLDREGYEPGQAAKYIEKWVHEQLLFQEARRRGMDRDDRIKAEVQKVERDLVIHHFLEALFAETITVTDEEIAAAYAREQDLFTTTEDEVHLLHLLTQTREEAMLAYRELLAGKPFEEVSRMRSIDLFKDRGGDWGFVRRSDLRPEVAREAFRLPEGGLSQVFGSPEGFHIVKVVAKRPQGTVRPLEEVRDEIQNRLQVTKERESYADLLYRLQEREKVFVADAFRTSTPADSLRPRPDQGE